MHQEKTGQDITCRRKNLEGLVWYIILNHFINNAWMPAKYEAQFIKSKEVVVIKLMSVPIYPFGFYEKFDYI